MCDSSIKPQENVSNYLQTPAGLSKGINTQNTLVKGESKSNSDRAFEINKMIIMYVLWIFSGFIILIFLSFVFLKDKKEFLELIKILLPLITFLLGLISSLGFVNYKINDKIE